MPPETRLKKVEEGKQAETKFIQRIEGCAEMIMDAKLLENVKKVEHLKGYLGTRFILTNTSKPHLLKF